MVYLQLQVRLRWSDAPPSCGTPIQDATSVDSAMLIMAAHSARTFKNSAPVGDNSWHDCIAWCNIPEPAPPAYATHNFVTEKPGYPVFSRRYGVQPQPHAATTLGKGETHIPCHHVSTEPAAPSHQGHEHAHCTTGHGKDVNGMNDDDDDGEDGQPCRFGRPCGVMLTDFSEDGLNRHLAQYHLQDLQDSIVRTP